AKERLAWESEYDCLRKMRQFIIDEVLVLPEEVEAIEKEAKQSAKQSKERAWKAFAEDIRKDQNVVAKLLAQAERESRNGTMIEEIRLELVKGINPTRPEAMRAAKK